MACRGIRGATTIERDDREEILAATRQLLALMVRRNDIDRRDVASAIFHHNSRRQCRVSRARGPAKLGWLDVPLLCGHELSVPGSLPRCIRVLVHWNTERAQDEIEHVYIRDAVRLRPDLSKLPPVNWDELEELDRRANKLAELSRVVWRHHYHYSVEIASSAIRAFCRGQRPAIGQ